MKFLNKIEQINDINIDIDVDIFDMEAAAIIDIAHKNKVKCIIIKCVSDAIGIDDSKLESINNRIEKAGEKAFDHFINLINHE
jgi:nucleoside phosphorylase